MKYGKIIGITLFVLMYCSQIVYSQAPDPSEEDSITYIEPQVGTYPLECIVPPDGFEVSDKFHGYINKNTSTSILVQLIDGIAYVNLEQSITSEHWASQSIEEVSKETFTTDSGMVGKLYKLAFNVSNTDIYRYMLITGDLEKTIWINISYPAQFDELLGPIALKSLRTVHLID
jgi:hypothetical protein